MGTRNLTIVINKEGETKVAQYGQWDGYPEGQGSIALKFLLKNNLEEFQKKIENCFFYKEGDIDENATLDKYPQLSRDHGADILNYIYENVKEDTKLGLIDSSDFAYDSLFCEWAYIIDFSKNTFEVYEGFQKNKLNKTQRFYNDMDKDGYYAVKMIDSYPLDKLPTVEEFIYNFTDKGFIQRQRSKKLNKIIK
ncbi:MAG: hypothetical protein HPY57_15965 [Ignavibacteria bacterium]|nr:hypothetical protein [Ignavibacteria bacterium]